MVREECARGEIERREREIGETLSEGKERGARH